MIESKNISNKIRISLFFIASLLCVLGVICWQFGSFTVEKLVVENESGIIFRSHSKNDSFKLKTEGKAQYWVYAQIKQPILGSDLLAIRVDDCLESLEIDGLQIRGGNLPHCDYLKDVTIPLSRLNIGRTFNIKAKLTNKGGPAKFEVIIRPFSIRSHAPIIFIAFIVCFLVTISLNKNKLSTFALFIIAGGFASRVIWYLFSSYTFFSHDLDGHIDYLRWVDLKWTIPGTKDGFQFYHPPFYYFFIASISAVLNFIGISSPLAELAYFVNFILALGTFIISIRIILLVLNASDECCKLISLAIVAFLPSSVFSNVRLNNDGLSIFLSFLAILYFIKWWTFSSSRYWIITSLLLTLSLATKSTALPLIAAVGIVGAVRLYFNRFQGIKIFLILPLVLSIYVFPYNMFRYYESGKFSLVGNSESLSSSLQLTNQIQDYITFSPVAIMQQKYLNPFWDSTRRNILWESIFKSAFTGEESLPLDGDSTVSYAHLLGFLFLVFFVRGIVTSTSKFYWPIISICILCLISLVVSRYLYPFGCTVNFRYHQSFLLVFSCLVGLGIPNVGYKFQAIKEEITLYVILAWIFWCSKILLFFHLS